MKKIVWILIILAVLAAGAVALLRKKGEPPIEVTIDKATRGDITSVVTATGKIFSEVEVRISSEVAGEIIELPVKDGSKVKRGDLLVRVNPDRLQAQVHQQEAALRATQANAAEARARMEQNKLDLERLRNLSEKGFSTEDQVEAAATQLAVSEAAYNATLSRIEQQEMSLQEAQDSLDKASTYSPIDGTVTSLQSELGDRVVGTGQFEGTEIMRVAVLEQMEVRVDVSEADIVSVKIGDLADVEIEALPNQIFKGSVTEIANSAGTGEEGQTQQSQQEATTFRVKVKLDEPSSNIRPGMTATADIKTKTVSDVVRVPLQAVTVRSPEVVNQQLGETAPAAASERGGPSEGPPRRRADSLQRVVFLYENDQVRIQRVTTGLSDSRFIEITSGIEPGVEVVTGSYRALTRELEHNKVVKIAQPTTPIR